MPDQQQSADWRTEVNSTLKELSQSLHEVLVEVRQRPTRPDIEQMLSTKVSVELYNAELKAIRDDITELKTRPERLHASVGTVTSIVCCVVTVVSLLITVVLLLHQYWH
jgi:hypothetical protein